MKTSHWGSFCCLLLVVFCAKAQNTLRFDPSSYTSQSQEMGGKTIKVRAFERVVYVANPVDTSYQKLNIYIPEEYFNGGSINGYTAQTAPIFFPNRVGGYMPAQPATFLNNSSRGGFGPPSNTVAMALARGYVVAGINHATTSGVTRSGDGELALAELLDELI